MQETKAIKPDVKELFETIIQQTKDYEKAFDYFEQEARKIERERRSLESLAIRLREDVDKSINELTKAVGVTLETLRAEINRTIQVYGSVKDVVKTKDTLINLSTTVQEQSVELERTLKNFKIRYDGELDTFLDKSSTKLKKDFDYELESLRVKSDIHRSQVDGRIFANERKVQSLIDHHTMEISRLTTELQSLKSIVTELSQTYQSTT